MDKGTSMTWRGSIKFQFTKATRQRWVFREERNCASVEANLKDNGREFQIAGPAYEKEVEPYFFDLVLGTTSSDRDNKYRRKLSVSYRLISEVR
jgi:hypothetical protein